MASSRKSGTNESISTYGAAGRNYTVLATWEAATDLDLVATTTSYVLECYDDAASFDDNVALGGATTSSSYFRIVRPATGQGHNGTPNNGVTFICTTVVHVFDLVEANSHVQDIIVKLNISSSLGKYAFYSSGGWVSSAYVGCIAFDCINSGAGSASGFRVPAAYNCLAHNCGGYGFYVSSSSARLYNCTATNNAAIGFMGFATGTAVNCCASGNTGGDWDGTWTQTTCTAEGANPTYVNAAGDDFHLASGDTVCKDQGTDLSADADYAFDDDIDKATRSGTWDIGFDEVTAGAGKIRLLPTVKF